MFVTRLRLIEPLASTKTTPASTATGRPCGSQPSTVTPEMSTVSGCDGDPTIATMSPRPLRRSGAASMIWPDAGPEDLGVIDTRSAPAPLSVRLLLIVSALVPNAPEPSAYLPGQTVTVSPGAAASTAA